MRIFKIILNMVIDPYRNLPWEKIISVFYTTFALWCFNLAVLVSILIVSPLLLKYTEQTFEAWWLIISCWFTSPYQLYYLYFCFVFSLILHFNE